MHLYIVQHGLAVAKEQNPERPLSDQGERDIRALGSRMRAMGVVPGVVIHSGKLRAKQTALILTEILAPHVQSEQYEGLGPMDDPSVFVTAIDQFQADAASSVLIATHMPFASKLASTLLARQPTTLLASMPGTAIALEYGEYGWQLDWMIRPECI